MKNKGMTIKEFTEWLQENRQYVKGKGNKTIETKPIKRMLIVKED